MRMRACALIGVPAVPMPLSGCLLGVHKRCSSGAQPWVVCVAASRTHTFCVPLQTLCAHLHTHNCRDPASLVALTDAHHRSALYLAVESGNLELVKWAP